MGLTPQRPRERPQCGLLLEERGVLAGHATSSHAAQGRAVMVSRLRAPEGAAGMMGEAEPLRHTFTPFALRPHDYNPSTNPGPMETSRFHPHFKYLDAGQGLFPRVNGDHSLLVQP